MNKENFVYVDVHYGGAKRTKWTRIRIDNVNEIQKFKENYKNQSVFATVQQFCVDIHNENEKQYAGLFFDFDAKGDFDFKQAQKDISALKNYFFTCWELKKTEVRFWFSGNRGFHMLIDPRALGVEGSKDLTSVFKEIALELKGQWDLKTLDEVIYSKRRMWRLPDSEHEKTGLFKIELADNELNLDEIKIRELAQKPRGELYEQEELDGIRFNEVASKIFDDFVFKVRIKISDNKTIAIDTKIKQLGTNLQDSPPLCVRSLLDEGIKEAGARNKTTMVLATYFKDNGQEIGICKKELKDWVSRIPDDLTDTKGEKRFASTESCIDTIYKNDKYHFRCEHVWGLGGWIACNSDVCPIRKYALNHNHIAETILKSNILICGVSKKDGKKRFEYANGVYRPIPRIKIDTWTKELTKGSFGIHKANEVVNVVDILSQIDIERVNADKNRLNLKNGIFNIDTLTLEEHTPDFLSSIQLDVNYDNDAKCPKWDKFLTEILDPPEIAALQEFFGYCLTPDITKEKFLICKGGGANGKGIALDVLEYVIGKDNMSAVGLKEIGNKYQMAHLFGKLVNICKESSVNAQVFEEYIKAFTSGDMLTAEEKFEAPFEYRPACKLIFAMNNLPKIADKTNSFYRRPLVIPFDKIFDESTANTQMKNRAYWEEELDGIFLWCLKGLERLRENGRFSESHKMKAVKADFREENNNVIIFKNECCEINGAMEVSKREIYESYRNFCLENGYHSFAMKKFGKNLRSVCPSIVEGKDTERTWKGIALNKEGKSYASRDKHKNTGDEKAKEIALVGLKIAPSSHDGSHAVGDKGLKDLFDN